jgi:hypothetical protein
MRLFYFCSFLISMGSSIYLFILRTEVRRTYRNSDLEFFDRSSLRTLYLAGTIACMFLAAYCLKRFLRKNSKPNHDVQPTRPKARD